MSSDFHCECGQTIVGTDNAIRVCPHCNRRLMVDGTETAVAAMPLMPARNAAEEYAVSETPLPSTPAPVHVEADEESFEQFRARRRREREAEDPPLRQSESLYKAPDMNASIGMGLALMFVAMVWFCGGLWLGFFFYQYPPILFLAGVIAVVRGAMPKKRR